MHVFTRPGLLVALGVIVAVMSVQLWVSPPYTLGFHRDEASISWNAYLLSQDLRDENGARTPLYFPSFGDVKSPVFVYALAAVFRVTGPSPTVARGLAATLVAGAILLLGLLAFRLTGSGVVAVATITLAALTPWLFELGRLAFEVAALPLLLTVLLLLVLRVVRHDRWTVRAGIPVGLVLGLVAYSYSAGRLLAPLWAGALIVLWSGNRWRWLGSCWTSFAISLVPLAWYWREHPGALTARFDATSIAGDGKSLTGIVGDAVRNYIVDLDLWRWVTSGSSKHYAHTWGGGVLLAGVAVLAVAGLVLVLVRHRDDLWWRWAIVAALLSPIPAALTVDRLHGLRLAVLPVFLLVFAVPALEALRVAARTRPVARVAVVVLALVTVVQFADFAGVYAGRDATRSELLEAGVPALLDRTLGQGRTVYTDTDDPYGRTHAGWYAAVHSIDQTRVVRLPDGGLPPDGGLLIGRTQACDFPCVELGRSGEYFLARAEIP